MISNYYRPKTLEEAQKMLSKPDTRPLAGGTLLSGKLPESFSVVDLQSLGLDKIRKVGNNLILGATVTLQALLEYQFTMPALKDALRLEAPLNLRTMGSLAGTLVASDGRSTFATVMLALDARITFNAATEQITLGNYFPLRSDVTGDLYGKLITSIEIPLNVALAFETLSRTPSDKPFLSAALAMWPSGRTRLAIGGWGATPALALDGNETGGVSESARQVCADSGDAWASAAYRIEMAGILATRCLSKASS